MSVMFQPSIAACYAGDAMKSLIRKNVPAVGYEEINIVRSTDMHGRHDLVLLRKI
jgi:hypothetical protein